MKITITKENFKTHIEMDTGSNVVQIERDTIKDVLEHLYEPRFRYRVRQELIDEIKRAIKR
jgi:hypothetical protein